MDVKADPAPVLNQRLDTMLFDQVIILVNIQSCLALREKAFPSMFGQPIEIPMLVVLWLLQPFSFFLRTPLLTAIGGTLVVSVLAFIYITLTSMQSTPLEGPGSMPVTYEPTATSLQRSKADEARVIGQDASMRSMLEDIYGE